MDEKQRLITRITGAERIRSRPDLEAPARREKTLALGRAEAHERHAGLARLATSLVAETLVELGSPQCGHPDVSSGRRTDLCVARHA
ncbi:hypothetical protein [Rhodoplanes azumiensis]|uniref:Uncharacterized protein n=1 Tax=Rhodoplanes azumiensis TaxID=1897628 RepID=A0ABW5AT01_9BRAD